MKRGGRVTQALESLRLIHGNREVRLLVTTQACIETAAWAFGIAFSIHAYEVGGAALVGLAVASRLAGAAAAAPFAGLLADRFGGRRLLSAAGVLAAVVLALTAAVVALDLPAAFAVFLSAVFGVCLVAFRPARSVLLPPLTRSADELTAANVLSGSFQSIALFAGPAAGGILYAASGPEVVFTATAVVFAASAALSARLPAARAAERRRPQRAADVARGLRGGLTTLLAESRLRVLATLFTAQTLVLGALNVLLVVVAFEILDAGPATVGLLVAAIGAGAATASLFTSALVGRRLTPVLAGAVCVWGAALALTSASGSAVVWIPLLALAGAASTLVDVSTYTLLQRAIDDGVRARVTAAFETMVLASLAAGGILAPVLLQFVSDHDALIAAGCFLPVVVLVLWQQLRQIDAATVWPAHETGLLAAIDIFSALPRATIEHLAAELSRVTVPAGREIITQGAPGRRFYVLDDGEVDVFVDDRLVRTLGAGSYFGEISLLRNQARTATVRARSEIELLALEPAEFIAAVTGHASAAEAAEAVIGERLSHARPQVASF